MVTIHIDNSYSKIQGLTLVQEKSLKKVLSYSVGSYAGYYSGGYGPKRVSLLDKRCYFPSGLLYRVTTFLDECGWIYTVIDRRTRPKLTPVKPILQHKPYEAQKRAIKAAIERKRGILTMPTGSGKSLVIGLIAAQYGLRTLIVVPNLEIKRQLIRTLVEILPKSNQWTVENIDSPNLKYLTDFDVLIIDEAHHVAAKTYRKLNKTAWSGIYYRFFLTATPFRNDTEETLLFESIAGQVIYQLTYKDAIKAGYIVPVDAFSVDIPTQDTDAYTWAEVYSQLVVNNESRNAIIANLLILLQQNTVHTLCLVKEVKHGQILSDLTGIPFACGADEDSRKYIRQFSANEIKAVIGTEGLLGEGIDTKPCEFVIIAGLGKAKSAFMQKVGRALRTYPGKESAKVIIFKDRSHKFLTRHFTAQCSILKSEYGIKPTKLEVK